VAAAGEVAVHDVEPGAVVELGVLEAFGGVELAVAGRGVVEELGEGPDDVVVVVEGLVVVAADAAVALDEDLAGGVDLDLPDLGVGEQVGEGLGDRGVRSVATGWAVASRGVSGEPDFDSECFLISPIGEDGSFDRGRADEVRDFIVKPAASRLGLEVVRADDISAPGEIPKQVVEHSVRAKAAVVDLTGANPNVLYELGIRHASGRVAVMISEDFDPPFDVAGHRTIRFDRTSIRSAQGCVDRIHLGLISAIAEEQVPYPEIASWQAGGQQLSTQGPDIAEDRYVRLVGQELEAFGELMLHQLEYGRHAGSASELPYRWFGWVRAITGFVGGDLRELLRLRLGFDKSGPLSSVEIADRLGIAEKDVLTLEATLAHLLSSDTIRDLLGEAEPWWPGRS
jgi:hypothetical protein